MTDATTYSSKLAGARVLVIGGSSGIGFAVASAVLEQGAGSIIIASSSQQKVDAAIERFRKAYPNKSQKVELLGQAINLKDQSNLEKNIEGLLAFATADKSKKLDHIVFTAGDSVKFDNKLEDINLQLVQEVGMVRFFAPLILCSRATAYLNPGPLSSITLTTGTVSQKPMLGWAPIVPYTTGLHGMTRSMALELKPIRVNLVSPGAVETEFWDIMDEGVREGIFNHVSKGLLTGRVGRPEDVAEAYLMSMRDSNCTGTVLDTNGGALVA